MASAAQVPTSSSFVGGSEETPCGYAAGSSVLSGRKRLLLLLLLLLLLSNDCGIPVKTRTMPKSQSPSSGCIAVTESSSSSSCYAGRPSLWLWAQTRWTESVAGLGLRLLLVHSELRPGHTAVAVQSKAAGHRRSKETPKSQVSHTLAHTPKRRMHAADAPGPL
ncbi:hypothetical protein CMUS01_13261 [Colletotrichum musicola]|uniref:Uncharacterized protein n=1 Tax=Colletotrichum musicola TaxID=2175873 RepID=A0A8H6JF97_9PEZI|nr:hypothetical protein CMUS01_13261 [Colletotrichum musicola]